MKRELIGVLASLVLSTSVTMADDESETSARTSKSSRSMDDRPGYGSTQMKRAKQQAMSHIKAAQRALDRNDTEAAQDALRQSERSLAKLHDPPQKKAMVQEIESVIASLETESLEQVDFEPLMRMARNNRAWVKPEISSKIAEADRKVTAGDAEGSADALRAVRSRLVGPGGQPDDEAYVRVLAAQRALEDDDTARAKRILKGIPAAGGRPMRDDGERGQMREAPMGASLAPVRDKLESAADAADDENWDRVSKMLDQANRELRDLEDTAADDPEMADELAALRNELEKLDRQLASGAEPSARKIRDLARRTQEIGES